MVGFIYKIQKLLDFILFKKNIFFFYEISQEM